MDKSMKIQMALERLDEMTCEKASEAIGCPQYLYANMTTSERHDYACDAWEKSEGDLDDFLGLYDLDIVLMEKPGCKGLTKEDVIALYDKLADTEAFPVEIGDVNGNCAVMGFITPKAAEALSYQYGQESDLGTYISSILEYDEEESEDETYTYQGLRILLSRD